MVLEKEGRSCRTRITFGQQVQVYPIFLSASQCETSISKPVGYDRQEKLARVVDWQPRRDSLLDLQVGKAPVPLPSGGRLKLRFLIN